MTDITVEAKWDRIGKFPLRCEVCDWLEFQLGTTTDAIYLQNLVSVETEHLLAMHSER